MSIFCPARLCNLLTVRFGWITLLSVMAALQAASQTQHTKPEPTPESAIPAILATFDSTKSWRCQRRME